MLLSALVKQAESPEEIAGVLAHEMGHGIEKDPEALFVRNIGMQTLISLLTGQSGDGSALEAGAFLLQLRYSRDAERTADARAIEILRKAGIAPKPTGDFFLRHASVDDGGVLSYLSTHPPRKTGLSSSFRSRLIRCSRCSAARNGRTPRRLRRRSGGGCETPARRQEAALAGRKRAMGWPRSRFAAGRCQIRGCGK